MSSRPIESITLLLLTAGLAIGAGVLVVRVVGGILAHIAGALASLP